MFNKGQEILENHKAKITKVNDYKAELEAELNKLNKQSKSDTNTAKDFMKQKELDYKILALKDEIQKQEEKIDSLNASTELFKELKEAIYDYRKEHYYDAQNINKEISEHIKQIRQLQIEAEKIKSGIILDLSNIIRQSEEYLPDILIDEGFTITPYHRLLKSAIETIYTDNRSQEVLYLIDPVSVLKR